jgi:hypothetical protein
VDRLCRDLDRCRLAGWAAGVGVGQPCELTAISEGLIYGACMRACVWAVQDYRFALRVDPKFKAARKQLGRLEAALQAKQMRAAQARAKAAQSIATMTELVISASAVPPPRPRASFALKVLVGAEVVGRLHGPQVSQSGQLLSRRGRSLPASASGFDTHRDSISCRFGCCRGVSSGR